MVVTHDYELLMSRLIDCPKKPCSNKEDAHDELLKPEFTRECHGYGTLNYLEPCKPIFHVGTWVCAICMRPFYCRCGTSTQLKAEVWQATVDKYRRVGMDGSKFTNNPKYKYKPQPEDDAPARRKRSSSKRKRRFFTNRIIRPPSGSAASSASSTSNITAPPSPAPSLPAPSLPAPRSPA